MVIYEVNLEVESSIEADYKKWFPTHVKEILKLDGFIDAVVYAREDAKSGCIGLTVHFRAADRKAIDTYLEEHAAHFRKDALDRFGSKFSATRRILEEVESVRVR